MALAIEMKRQKDEKNFQKKKKKKKKREEGWKIPVTISFACMC